MANVTLVQNPDGSWTSTNPDGTILNWSIGADPNGSGRLQVLVAPPASTLANIMEMEHITAGRASARLVNEGGTAWVLTQPATIPNPQAGLIAWAG